MLRSSRICSLLLVIAAGACGASSKTAPTTASGASTSANATTRDAIVAWMKACAASDAACSTVAISPDLSKVAILYHPDDSGRGWTGLSVAIFDVMTHVPERELELIERKENNDDKPGFLLANANEQVLHVAAQEFVGWTVEVPVATTLTGLSQVGVVAASQDDEFQATVVVNGNSISVELPGRLRCEGSATAGKLGFRPGYVKAHSVGQGAVAVVTLDGGRYGDLCAMTGPSKWVGALANRAALPTP